MRIIRVDKDIGLCSDNVMSDNVMTMTKFYNYLIISFFLPQTEVLEGTETQMSKTSKINLIDLAGSERASTALNDDVIDSKQTYDLRLKVYLMHRVTKGQ